MTGEQYFEEDPTSRSVSKQIDVHLAGTKFSVVTASGVFSPDRLDKGTSILLNNIENIAEKGEIADLGAGWGAISIALASQSPQARVTAIEINNRSLGLLRENKQRLGLENLRVCRPEDVDQNQTFRQIWSNPPIRIGKEKLHELLSFWLQKLDPDGEAFLVVQKHLGADSLQSWMQTSLGLTAERIENSKGYRVLRVTKLR